ncbi:MAG: hypothetical protein SGPRY_001513 [Prymnesium sp.]
MLWLFLQGQESERVVFKERPEGGGSWDSLGQAFNRGNSWWSAQCSHQGWEHSAWVGDRCLVEGIVPARAGKVEEAPASGTFPMLRGMDSAIEAAEGSMASLLSLLKSSQTVISHLTLVSRILI